MANGIRSCFGFLSWKQTDITEEYFMLEDVKCLGSGWAEAGKGM